MYTKIERQDILNKYSLPFVSKEVQKKALQFDTRAVMSCIKRFKGAHDLSDDIIDNSFELYIFKKLVERYGLINVFYQYGLHPFDSRYPYHCDFYVKSCDLFIELHMRPVHGGAWYDGTHADKLRYQHLTKSPKKLAIKKLKIWGGQDVEKRACAKKNQLNYLVFWDVDLFDFTLWYEDYNCDTSKFIKDFPKNSF